MLIISGVLGLLLTLIVVYAITMPHKVVVMMSVMAIIPLVTGFFVLKRKTWALWMGLIYFAIQVAWVKSESFSWNFEFASPISMFISSTVAGVEVGVNFVAIAMFIVFIQLLWRKNEP